MDYNEDYFPYSVWKIREDAIMEDELIAVFKLRDEAIMCTKYLSAFTDNCSYYIEKDNECLNTQTNINL